MQLVQFRKLCAWLSCISEEMESDGRRIFVVPPTRVDTHTKQMHTIKQRQNIKQVHTYTPDGNPEFRYVFVSECSSQHCHHKVSSIFQHLKQYIRDGISG